MQQLQLTFGWRPVADWLANSNDRSRRRIGGIGTTFHNIYSSGDCESGHGTTGATNGRYFGLFEWKLGGD
jgi:hypothetical protein